VLNCILRKSACFQLLCHKIVLFLQPCLFCFPCIVQEICLLNLDCIKYNMCYQENCICFLTLSNSHLLNEYLIISCSNVEGCMELQLWERACSHYERPCEHPYVQGSEWMDCWGLEKYLREIQPAVSFSTLHKGATTREGEGAKGKLKGNTRC